MSEMLKQSRGAALWISALALMISLVGVTTARQAGAQERGPLTREQARALEQLEEAFTAIADAVEPVVVQIKVDAARPRFRSNEENEGMPDRPDDFFRQFPFGPNLRPVPPRGAGGTGSGVIVKIDGHDAYILTNDRDTPKYMRLSASKKTPLFNGALDCRLFEFKMVAGSARKPKAHAPVDEAQ